MLPPRQEAEHETLSLPHWGSPEAPYYEHAVMCRALENTIYLASVNVGFRFPESATAVLAPDGTCLARLSYGEPGLLLADLDLDAAAGLLASRFAPDWRAARPGPSPVWRLGRLADLQ